MDSHRTTRLASHLALGAALLLGSCRAVLPPPPEELDLWVDAAAGVQETRLARLCEDVWDAHLAANPIEATYLGDPRFHGDVPRTDPRWKDLRREELRQMRRRLGEIDPESLAERDRITHELLGEHLATELTRLDLALETFTVDPLRGEHIRFLNVAQVQPTGTAREREQLLERWNKIAGVIHQRVRDFQRGQQRGLVPSRTPVLKTIEQIEAILDTPPMDSPLVEVTTGGGGWVELGPNDTVSALAHEHLGDARLQSELRLVNLHLQDGERLAIGTRVLIPAADDPLAPGERGELLYGALQAVEDGFYPALASYRDFLLDRVLPRARDDASCGLAHLVGGDAIYRALIQEHTSLPAEECDPQAIHEFGQQEVERIRGEIASLGSELFGTGDVAAIQERLRNDAEAHFRTRDEVQTKATEALYRAHSRMAEYFGILPEAACEVVRIPAHEERDTTIAYYREPSADGAEPGRYFVNTYEPQTRPRYEAEVLAYHEAIPGHHLQIAIAQELEDLPRFRRHLGSTAFVEGWALYTERLADEMELYSGDMDRLGVLSFDAWRAARLVVDTGIHAFGWSRSRAIEYLYENTLLARNNVENEVDRYIAWPGQALAYKIGQREILELRREAREALGSAFSYPEFHDRILENGAVSLVTLRGIVRRWLGLSGSGLAG